MRTGRHAWLSIIGIVVAIIGFFVAPVPLGIIGAVLGVIGLWGPARDWAWAAIIVGLIVLILGLW
ncbi:MAG TPA: hypothetical protein VF149_02550 [Bacillales bacterium]